MATISHFGQRGSSAPPTDPMAQYLHIPPKRAPEPNAAKFDIGKFLFSFEGRISRLQFCLGQLVVVAAFQVDMLLKKGLLDALTNFRQSQTPLASLVAFGLLSVLLMLAAVGPTLWISFALVVKRFHDREKSWAWSLLVFVPIAGPLWQTVECGFLPGTDGANEYGPSPDAAKAPDELYALFN